MSSIYTRRTFIVNGYGCNLKSPLEPYLLDVWQDIKALQPERTFFTGGPTQQQKFPGMTEARVMAGYIKELATKEGKQHLLEKVHLDEDAYTTLDNVLAGAAYVRSLLNDPWTDPEPRREEIYVWCEAQRALKVQVLWWLALPELRRDARGEDTGNRVIIKSRSWELSNPLWEILKIPMDITAYYLPPLASYLRHKRMARAATI